jgi:WD40 repeat protein
MWFRNRLSVCILFLAYTSISWAQDGSFILNRKIYKEPLTSINVSPDGLFLLAGFNDGSFRLLDPDSFEPLVEVEQAHIKAVNAMDMPPKMDYILTAGHNRIKIWDPGGNFLGEWKGHATTIWNAEIGKDGKWAVSSAMNKTFLLWDAPNGELADQMRGHEDVTMAVAISPDSRRIASGSNDLTIKIWDLGTRQVISQLHGPTQDIYDLEFSPDGSLLAAASRDRSVRVYDLNQEKLLHLLKGHQDMVMEAEFSPDGRYLVTASADQSVMLWEVGSGERIHQFLENEGAVMDLVFHPDGQSFYSISYGGDLTRWGLDPEIFVLHYFEGAYLDELTADPLFGPRQNGESKKDFQNRMERAAVKKRDIVARYYRNYLEQRER